MKFLHNYGWFMHKPQDERESAIYHRAYYKEQTKSIQTILQWTTRQEKKDK